MAKNRLLTTDPCQVSAVALTWLVLVGCANPAREPITVSDWCWLHYRLAPPGALASDVGPESTAEAAVWSTWLGPTTDAPVDRHDAHSDQRRLIDRFNESGGWSDDERQRYRTTAQTEPTPATICETVGARIAVTDDGSVRGGWDARFLDPDDPAYSTLAVASLDR